MNDAPCSPQDIASAARAAYRFGWAENAFDAARSYDSARDLLEAWSSLEDLQKRLGFYFYGRLNEEPQTVTQARRVSSRGPRKEFKS